MKIIYGKNLENLNLKYAKIVYYEDAIFEVIEDLKDKSSTQIIFDDLEIKDKNRFYLNIIKYILLYEMQVYIINNKNFHHIFKKIIKQKQLELVEFANANNIEKLDLLIKNNIFKFIKEIKLSDIKFANNQIPLNMINLEETKNMRSKETINNYQLAENEINFDSMEFEDNRNDVFNQENKFLKKIPMVEVDSSEKKLRKILLLNMSISEYKNIFNIKYEKYIKVLTNDNIISFLNFNKSNLRNYTLYAKFDINELCYSEEILNILYYINSEFTLLNSNIFVNTKKGMEFFILKNILNNFNFLNHKKGFNI